MKIGQHSTLRKLMRAAKQGKIPPERKVIIDIAERKSKEKARHKKATKIPQ